MLIKDKTLEPNIKPSGLIVQVTTYNKNITMNFNNQFILKLVNLLLDDIYQQLKTYFPFKDKLFRPQSKQNVQKS